MDIHEIHASLEEDLRGWLGAEDPRSTSLDVFEESEVEPTLEAARQLRDASKRWHDRRNVVLRDQHLRTLWQPSVDASALTVSHLQAESAMSIVNDIQLQEDLEGELAL